jgi:hypothetical protein
LHVDAFGSGELAILRIERVDRSRFGIPDEQHAIGTERERASGLQICFAGFERACISMSERAHQSGGDRSAQAGADTNR